jgi:hypothetical protein
LRKDPTDEEVELVKNAKNSFVESHRVLTSTLNKTYGFHFFLHSQTNQSTDHKRTGKTKETEK